MASESIALTTAATSSAVTSAASIASVSTRASVQFRSALRSAAARKTTITAAPSTPSSEAASSTMLCGYLKTGSYLAKPPVPTPARGWDEKIFHAWLHRYVRPFEDKSEELPVRNPVARLSAADGTSALASTSAAPAAPATSR